MEEANCIFNITLKSTKNYIKIKEKYIVLYISPSTNDKVNDSIESFVKGKKGKAIVSIRKNTSTNPIVLNVVCPDDVHIVYPSRGSVKIKRRKDDSLHDDVIHFKNGKFYRKRVLRKAYKICVKKSEQFNTSISDIQEFMTRLDGALSGELGFVSPKMSSGKLPFVRGIMSLMGHNGKKQSKDPRLLLKYTSVFIKIVN